MPKRTFRRKTVFLLFLLVGQSGPTSSWNPTSFIADYVENKATDKVSLILEKEVAREFMGDLFVTYVYRPEWMDSEFTEKIPIPVDKTSMVDYGLWRAKAGVNKLLELLEDDGNQSDNGWMAWTARTVRGKIKAGIQFSKETYEAIAVKTEESVVGTSQMVASGLVRPGVEYAADSLPSGLRQIATFILKAQGGRFLKLLGSAIAIIWFSPFVSTQLLVWAVYQLDTNKAQLMYHFTKDVLKRCTDGDIILTANHLTNADFDPVILHRLVHDNKERLGSKWMASFVATIVKFKPSAFEKFFVVFLAEFPDSAWSNTGFAVVARDKAIHARVRILLSLVDVFQVMVDPQDLDARSRLVDQVTGLRNVIAEDEAAEVSRESLLYAFEWYASVTGLVQRLEKDAAVDTQEATSDDESDTLEEAAEFLVRLFIFDRYHIKAAVRMGFRSTIALFFRFRPIEPKDLSDFALLSFAAENGLKKSLAAVLTHLSFESIDDMFPLLATIQPASPLTPLWKAFLSVCGLKRIRCECTPIRKLMKKKTPTYYAIQMPFLFTTEIGPTQINDTARFLVQHLLGLSPHVLMQVPVDEDRLLTLTDGLNYLLDRSCSQHHPSEPSSTFQPAFRLQVEGEPDHQLAVPLSGQIQELKAWEEYAQQADELKCTLERFPQMIAEKGKTAKTLRTHFKEPKHNLPLPKALP